MYNFGHWMCVSGQLRAPTVLHLEGKVSIRNVQNTDRRDGEEKTRCFCQELNLGHPQRTSPLTITCMIDRTDFIEG